MEIGVAILLVASLVIAIWVIVELKRMKHKIFAILLIAMILFLYVTSGYVFEGKEVNFRTIDGLKEASSLYFVWFGSFFNNLKSITVNAIKMNWKGNVTSG
ncbi:hypothetical protein KAJ87_01200 [Candidatus Pacearchaeota archaeon]|nr:hypothetical protein [Candidatus Pacearchaeota archaeon]